jgi:tRNA uridine 5-carbamoylmethylation protein Kti12
LPEYSAIAVVFATPEPDELARRLASRPGKTIPPEVIERMIENWEEPTLDEGFKEIWRV